MSYFNFLIHGVNGLQKQYARENFRSTITYEGHTDNFQGDIKAVKQDDKAKIIQVDKVFEITLLSDTALHNCRSAWGGLQRSTKITFIVTLIGGLAGVVAAVSMCALSLSLLIPAVAIGVIALTFFAFSCLAMKRSLTAGSELEKWKDPIHDLIEECRNLNCRLKIEKNMEVEIESIINESSSEILKIMGQGHGEFYDGMINMHLDSLALKINGVWAKYSHEMIENGMQKIPREKIYAIMDSYIKIFSKFERVKKLLMVKTR